MFSIICCGLTDATIILGMKKTVFVLVVMLLSIASTATSAQVKHTHVKKDKAALPAGSDIYRMQEGFVNAHGVLIYYQIIGHGAPLMIVHGGPGASHDYLMPYLLPLARTNQIIFIDERGSGRSEKLE